jgi:hypothetical protein
MVKSNHFRSVQPVGDTTSLLQLPLKKFPVPFPTSIFINMLALAPSPDNNTTYPEPGPLDESDLPQPFHCTDVLWLSTRDDESTQDKYLIGLLLGIKHQTQNLGKIYFRHLQQGSNKAMKQTTMYRPLFTFAGRTVPSGYCL